MSEPMNAWAAHNEWLRRHDRNGRWITAILAVFILVVILVMIDSIGTTIAAEQACISSGYVWVRGGTCIDAQVVNP